MRARSERVHFGFFGLFDGVVGLYDGTSKTPLAVRLNRGDVRENGEAPPLLADVDRKLARDGFLRR